MSLVTEALRKSRKRAFARLRGESSIDKLIAAGLQVGEGTHFGRPLHLDSVFPWLITIEDHVTLGQNVIIITHDTSLSQYTSQTKAAPVVVGKRAFIGSGAILLPGTTIGEDSVVSAGAVVHGEIPPGSLVAGNPAKVVSKVKAVAAFARADAARAPNWPKKSPGMRTEALRCAQREALADGASAYVPASAAPGSPYALSNEGNPEPDG